MSSRPQSSYCRQPCDDASSYPSVTVDPLPGVLPHCYGEYYHSNNHHHDEEKTGTRSGVYEAPDDDDLNRHEARCCRRASRGSLWARGIAAVSPLISSSDKESADVLPLLPFHRYHSKYPRRWLRKSSRSCCVLYCFVGLFAMLGVFQFISLACAFAISFFPDEIDRAADRWRQHEGDVTPDVTRWPTDISRDIVPVGCHSHNDYWRRVPLYSALQAGCIGVEADVWLFENELYVGHTTSSLTPARTLRNMYIDPLMNILDRQNPISYFHPTPDQPLNGVFDTDPSQTLVLLIDFKTDGRETWPHVYSQLAPLRERGYLTYYNGTGIVNGPITVVGTGDAPFNLVTANTTYRDIFFDAPLSRLVDELDGVAGSSLLRRGEQAKSPGQGLAGISAADIGTDLFDTTNSYYASVSFKETIGFPWMFRLTESQMEIIRAQVEAAHQRGLKVRYWGTPSWPRSLRDHIWSVLVREGVDILNVDDLRSATRGDWTPKIFNWWR